ncbi:DUF3105 domain-containing protein [Pseudonocardia pini]|uniref:DUF3105 domain-containing protein n=1 Tax=Pseudonocardia pini TaxID=2758030 RepID=UPI0015F111E3|nr:DUF3105 domain-containing protein [Pseudonocardia pini]
MASGKQSKANRNKGRNSVVAQKSTPWGLIAGIVVVVLFAGAIFGYAVLRGNENSAAQEALAPWTPTDTNRDPSLTIPGIVTDNYTGSGQGHVQSPTRVAYTHSPPMGGDHDYVWAACSGVVYEQAVRSEHMVHALEHGAVWIAYNPDQVAGAALETLRGKVENETYLTLSPYPGLDQPISLQSWNHQLKLSDANDPRIDQFITALKLNRYTYPEIGATCAPNGFSQSSPPPFVPAPSVDQIDGTAVVAERGAGAPAGSTAGQ